ncbi:gas vesicle protein GvpL [Priestia megaterium]|uniref:GvpL/GvpF family gas vesicle protein n=1 Tax=Priestia megaterium TaxID=1404 RepID=UPI000BF2DA9F|nr:GvpL/GvpF family gas vesicle protein [Priestia megaterium]PET73225.1 gas vesicle protein GvpL [Priestia megaterium]PFK89346.1 gas vesicle protein GvpL [Priestia megaterium]
MEKLIYLYGLVPTEEAKEMPFPSLEGMDQNNPIYALYFDDITAFVCDLPSDEYSEEMLKEKIEHDMKWLQDKAMHHHETLLFLQSHYTLLPMKFCTVYKSKESCRESIVNNKEKNLSSLQLLKRSEEWNIKVYAHTNSLKNYLLTHNETIQEKKKEITTLPPGRQFFERKKIERLIEEETEKEQLSLCDHLHSEISPYAAYHKIKNNWSQKITGESYSMCWNSIYLLSKNNVESFLKAISDKQTFYNKMGLNIEVTGPWPAYHIDTLRSEKDAG